MREISISWDPDPIGTIYIQMELKQWRLDCAGGLFVVPGHIRGIGSSLSGLRPQSIFSGECSKNKHHQQFVFLQPCIISCLPLAFDHTQLDTLPNANKLALSSVSSVFPPSS